MDLRRLSFDSMPPLAVPLRFFISAPCFAIVVAVLLLFAEPFELSSRWSNFLLAVTHGITLGFMLMIMAGALFQVLPVVLGVAFPKTNILSKLVHLLLSTGTLALIAGLYWMNTYLLIIAGGLLSTGLMVFFAGFIGCIGSMRNTASSWAIRFALLSLLITISFGLLFLFSYQQPSWFPQARLLTNIHLLWG